MTKPLYLFIGRSASGKTTIADILEQKYGLVQTSSYTTRPPRYEGEIGHVFISDAEFDKLENIVAYTEYNGYRYAATAEQIDNISIYVVDIPGVETLLERYHNDRPIMVFYFDASVRTRIERMLNRHDCDAAIVSRLYNDEAFDWEGKLAELVWKYKDNEQRNITLYNIDANRTLDAVLGQVELWIGEYI